MLQEFVVDLIETDVATTQDFGFEDFTKDAENWIRITTGSYSVGTRGFDYFCPDISRPELQNCAVLDGVHLKPLISRQPVESCVAVTGQFTAVPINDTRIHVIGVIWNTVLYIIGIQCCHIDIQVYIEYIECQAVPYPCSY